MNNDQAPMAIATPVEEKERITILDSLRGIAILGILLMNIPGFSLPRAQIFNLAIFNETSGPNFYAWYIIEWLVEGSQRGIFSMLFGAGMFLFITRLQKKSTGMEPAEYFIRRQLWLLVFGLFNAYVLLWYWDILFHYSIIGIVLFAFWRQSPRKLFIAAGVCLVLMTARENIDFYREKAILTKGIEVASIDTSRTKLTTIQTDQLKEMKEFTSRDSIANKMKGINKNLEAVRGDYSGLYRFQSNVSYEGQTGGTYHFLFWDVLLFMFLGLGFFKSGVLTGQVSTKIYWYIFIIGLGIGLPLSYIRLQPLLDFNFSRVLYLQNVHFEFYEISRLFRSLGIFGLIMLLYKSGLFKWLFELMRPVGQMAFTNYLMQSFLCGLFFYGIGFGYFGKLQRFEIYYVVLAIWIIEIIWSHIWLTYFRFGPLEWCWRCLTYWKLQSIKRID